MPQQDSKYIFPARGGGPKKDISKDPNVIKKAGGLPINFCPFHGIRHVYASALASSGKIDTYTLQMLLTHKSPKTTQRYAHLKDKTLRRTSSVADDGDPFCQFLTTTL